MHNIKNQKYSNNIFNFKTKYEYKIVGKNKYNNSFLITVIKHSANHE